MMKKYVGMMIILVAVLAGCGKKELSVADFSAVKVGMTEQEVKKVVGKPTEIDKDLDNQRIIKNIAPFKDDLMGMVGSLSNKEDLVEQLSKTITLVEEGADVTSYTYDYPSKERKEEETSTVITFCDGKVSLIVNDDELVGLYGD